MSADAQVMARNTTHFTIALVAQKVISFLYFTYLARIFVPAEIGQYVFALSFTLIFSVLIDVGLGYVLTTEVAKDKSRAQEYWQNTIGFKLIAIAGTIIIAWVAINLMGYSGLTRELVYISFIIMVLDSFMLSAYSLIRAYQNLWWESLGTVLFQFIVAIAGFIITQFTRDLRFIILALVLAGLVNVTYSWNRLASFGIKLWPKFDSLVIKKLLILAWPFGVALLLTRLYGYSDTVLLSWLAGDAAVGYYSVAYKITFAWQFIASAFAASLLPGFSSYFAGDKSLLVSTFTKSVHYLNVISFPLAAGFFVLGPAVIRFIYPQYQAAILPLQILIFSLVFIFLTFPVGSLLSAGGRQKRNTLNLLITVVISVALNIMLIPQYQAVGAAVASLVSAVIYFILGWSVIHQLIQVSYKQIIFNVFRVGLSAICMGIIIKVLQPQLNLLLVIFIGMVSYGIFSLVLKSFSMAEIKNFKRLIFSRG